MGNVNESKEREACSLAEDSSDTSSPAFDFEEYLKFPDTALEQDTLDADLPIKFFVASTSLNSGIYSIESEPPIPGTPLEELEAGPQDNTEQLDELNSYAETSRDDSFPLSESALPSSFDLLVETSPILTEGSDAYHTPDVSQLDIAVEESIHTSVEVPSPPQAITPADNDSTAVTVSNHGSPPNLLLEESPLQLIEATDLEHMEGGDLVLPPSCLVVVSALENCPNLLLEESPLQPVESTDAKHMNGGDSTLPSPRSLLLDQVTDLLSQVTLADASEEGPADEIVGLYTDDGYTVFPHMILDQSTPKESFVDDSSGRNDAIDQDSSHDMARFADLPILTALQVEVDINDVALSTFLPEDTSRFEKENVTASDVYQSYGISAVSFLTGGETTSNSPSQLADACLQSWEPNDSIGAIPILPVESHSKADQVTNIRDLSKQIETVPLPPSLPDGSEVVDGEVTNAIFFDTTNTETWCDRGRVNRSPAISGFASPQHSADKPNWALAPINLADVRSSAQQKPDKIEDRRTSSGRGKQRREDTLSRSRNIVRESHTKNRSSAMPDSMNISESISSSGNGSKSAQAAENTRAETVADKPQPASRQKSPEDAAIPQPRSIGKGRRARGASISFSQDAELVPSASSTSQGLSAITEAAATSDLSTTRRLPFPAEARIKSVEDKIAAIIMETRRSTPGRAQRPAKPKQGTGIPQTGPSLGNSPAAGTPRKGRVSWPSATDEQGFQTNVRPPLPWRTGIGRALTTHLGYTPAPSKPQQGVDRGNRRSVGPADQSSSRGKTLQLGHDEFLLHTHERDGPVKVNLPSTPKTANREQPIQPSAAGPTVSASMSSTFHSNIPVATRGSVNRGVGPSESSFPPYTMNLMQSAADGWQSPRASYPPQKGPIANSQVSNNPRVGHGNYDMSQHGPSSQNLKSFQSLARISEYANAQSQLQAANRYSSQSSLHAQASDAASNYPFETAAGQQGRASYPSMQHTNNQDLLNHLYTQGQQRGRDQIELMAMNPPRATEHFQGGSGAMDTLDGWRSGYSTAFSSHSLNGAPQNYRHVGYQSAMPASASHARPQYPERSLSGSRGNHGASQ